MTDKYDEMAYRLGFRSARQLTVIAAAIRRAVEEEREACARVADACLDEEPYESETAWAIAMRIRARKP